MPDTPRERHPGLRQEEREALLRRTLDAVEAALRAGDTDSADAAMRAVPMSSLMSRGWEVHATFRAIAAETGVDLLDPTRPSLLVAVAKARLHALGDITAWQRPLREAVALLARAVHTSPVERARDLATAALCADLAGRPTESLDLARRAADLIESLGDRLEQAAEELAGATACELAVSFFAVQDYAAAVRMWSWVRARTSDPGSALLGQADWGLALTSIIAGDRSAVPPMIRSVVAMRHDDPARAPFNPVDPWWAMLEVARAWERLDALDALEALDITRHVISVMPRAHDFSPLVLAHVIALVSCGRAATAREFLDAVDAVAWAGTEQHGRVRSFARAIVAAIMGDIASAREHADAIDDAFAEGRLWRAYVELCIAPTRDVLGILGLGAAPAAARSRSLHACVLAAAEVRAGNAESAAAALDVVAAIAETRGVRNWLLLIPEGDMRALRAIADASSPRFPPDLLPDATAVAVQGERVVLTDREAQIYRLVARDRSNPEIADELFISRNTVKFHLQKLYRSLGVSSRAEAAAVFREPVPLDAGRWVVHLGGNAGS